MVYPAAEAMGKTSSDGDDGAGLPGYLMNLRGDVEIREGVINFDGAVEVDVVVSSQGFAKMEKKLVDELVGSVNGDSSGVIIDLFVGCGIAEVIGEHPANIFLVLNNAWAEVFIRRKDYEVLIIS